MEMQLLVVTDWWMISIRIVDNVLFVMCLVAVCYLFVFALGSTLKRDRVYKPAKTQNRYLVLFCINNRQDIVLESVISFRLQDYPSDKYDIIVISNERYEAVNEKLRQQDFRVITVDSKRYTKAQSIKQVMAQIPDNIYDAVVIMNEDSIVTSDFMHEVNNAFATGRTAIQTHRISRHLETDTALFGAVSEEINNSIFRKGHVNLGFSSALIGSGMIFKFNWLKTNIANTNDSDLEKQLEKKLLEQFIFTDYLSKVTVYSEKEDNASEYYKQRNAWLTNRLENVKIMLHRLPNAMLRGNYDYVNKLIQWLLPSRTILIGILFIISTFLILFSWGMAIKWIIILLILIVSFSVALPDYLIDARFVKALRGAPVLFFLALINTIRRKIGLNKRKK